MEINNYQVVIDASWFRTQKFHYTGVQLIQQLHSLYKRHQQYKVSNKKKKLLRLRWLFLLDFTVSLRSILFTTHANDTGCFKDEGACVELLMYSCLNRKSGWNMWWTTFSVLILPGYFRGILFFGVSLFFKMKLHSLQDIPINKKISGYITQFKLYQGMHCSENSDYLWVASVTLATEYCKPEDQ